MPVANKRLELGSGTGVATGVHRAHVEPADSLVSNVVPKVEYTMSSIPACQLRTTYANIKERPPPAGCA